MAVRTNPQAGKAVAQNGLGLPTKPSVLKKGAVDFNKGVVAVVDHPNDCAIATSVKLWHDESFSFRAAPLRTEHPFVRSERALPGVHA